MFLEHIEIFGFKSFADKSRIAFDKGMSVVVGPNGCGKSNVVDALRWVLGEQGAKGLRADKMVSVIFNGTETRHPLNVAEVSLTFSNEQNILPLEFSEIEIKRRVFRDGTSEYYINKNQVPLRELRELLADTGVGNTEYVVMEQGRMDQILEAKPTERRQILEEAAGIVKHRMRSLEGARRLEKVQVNKTQIMQVLSEVKTQHSRLEEQCKKTLQYRKYKELIFTYELQKTCAQYNTLYNTSTHCVKEKESLEQQIHKCTNSIAQLYKDNEDFISSIKDHQKNIGDKQEKISSLTAHIQRVQESIEKSKEYLLTIGSQITTQQSQLQVLQKRAASENKEQKSLLLRIEKQHIEETELDTSIQTIREKLTDIDKQIHDCDKNIQSSVKKNIEVGAELEVHQKDLREVVDRLAAELDKQLSETGYSIETQQMRTDKIFADIKTAQSSLDILARENNVNTIHSNIKKIHECIKNLAKNFKSYSDTQPTFLQEFLSRDGVLSRKHIIDKKISQLYKERDSLRITQSERQTEKDTLITNQAALKNDLQAYMVKKASIERENFLLSEQVKKIEKVLLQTKEEEKRQEENVKKLLHSKERVIIDIDQEKKQCESLRSEDVEARKVLKMLQKSIEKQNNMAHVYTQKIRDADNEIKKLRTSVHEIEKQEADITTRCNVLAENFAERYGEILSVYLAKDEYKNITKQTLARENISENLQKTKDAMKALGGVNLLAPDEFRQINTRYEFLTSQLTDLEEAENDLKKIVEEIEKESRKKLEVTYAEVRKHFKRIFTKLMDGGTADLLLVDSDDILSAGLDIVAQPPQKKTKNLSQLSGGERALVSLALLFSIHSVRPAPFCVLDELDAPLDEQNIGRFLALVDDFSSQTQFIVISHNKRTIASGKQMIGVTMEERGVSKIIGVKTGN